MCIKQKFPFHTFSESRGYPEPDTERDGREVVAEQLYVYYKDDNKIWSYLDFSLA